MSRAAWFTVVFVLVMAGGAIAVHQSFTKAQERLSVQRSLSEVRLKEFAAALAGYRERHQAWPDTLFALMKDAKMPFGANLVRGAGQYMYRMPPAGADPSYLVMTSDGFHAGVKAGESWGAEGQTAAADIPPVAYVLTYDLKVEALDPVERDRRWHTPAAPTR